MLSVRLKGSWQTCLWDWTSLEDASLSCDAAQVAKREGLAGPSEQLEGSLPEAVLPSSLDHLQDGIHSTLCEASQHCQATADILMFTAVYVGKSWTED